MGEVRFMISEAAKQVKVESHVLRYWEEELDLEIGRTEMGHRYYTKDDIQLFRCIKKLKDEGMLLKDLKPLIPELRATRLKVQENVSQEIPEKTSEATPVKKDTIPVEKTAGKEITHHLSVAPKEDRPAPLRIARAEVIPVTQLEQVRTLIGDVLTEVVTTNNESLKKDISQSVTKNVMREMDFLFQAKERQEEEHFRKLDCLIRQQQASRREAAHEPPMTRLKKLFN